MFEDIFDVLRIRASGWCQLRENLELQSDNLPDESGGRQPVHLLRKGQQGVPRAETYDCWEVGRGVAHGLAKLLKAGPRRYRRRVFSSHMAPPLCLPLVFYQTLAFNLRVLRYFADQQSGF